MLDVILQLHQHEPVGLYHWPVFVLSLLVLLCVSAVPLF